MQENHDETRWKQIALFLLTIGALVFCALLLQPFFAAIVGAIVLAVVTRRPYDWLAARIKNRSASALLALIFVILAVIVPLFLLAQDIGQQALLAIATLRSDATQQKITAWLAVHPAVADRLQDFTDSFDINTAARSSASWIGTHMAGFLGTSVRLITQLVVMLFLLFFLFRDRAEAIAFFRSLLPLREDETDEFLLRVGDTILASALGRLSIALVQGVLAGLAFWVLGVPGVILWSCTLTGFAMIPAFGAFLVWGPIAIWLGLNGHWGKAALLAVWGGVIVSTIDNILYPILVGTHLRAHTAAILLSILGGIALFGITGVILGPLTFTVAATFLDIWRARSVRPLQEQSLR